MKTFAWLLGLLFVSVALAADPPVTRFEAYPLGFADEGAVLELVRGMVGEGGSAVMDRQGARVLVVTTDANHAQIAELLHKLNVPPKNVRIEVRFKGSSADDHTAVGVSGEAGFSRTDGISHSEIRIKPRIESTSMRAASDVAQILMVASGREGMLQVGERVPYVEWLVDYGLRCGVLLERVAWQQVGSTLVVEPTVVGDGPMVRVKLTPELSGMVNGRPERIRFANVATEVVVQDGQTFQVGGLEQNQDFYSHFLVGFDRGGSSQSLNITLTPRIMPAPRMP
ncbi:MAG TPA: hypothetical protein PLE77_06250 [Kiritimatiellia bacterium]|nr:hypothetical protein [Kiritimatiellia bacterium]